MKVKMLMGAVFAGGARAPVQSYPAGSVAEVTQQVGADLIRAGLAETAEEAELGDEVPVEARQEDIPPVAAKPARKVRDADAK